MCLVALAVVLILHALDGTTVQVCGTPGQRGLSQTCNSAMAQLIAIEQRDMKFQKTEKGRAEIAPGVRTLGQRERTFLLLADGHRTVADIALALGGDVEAVARKLVAAGYLDEAIVVDLRSPGGTGGLQHQPPVAAGDPFEGRRSLATTRMFLFDISERMFSRQSPELAVQFRNDLRNARDRESMLDVSRQMLTEVERIAGAARADSISERLAMLLPVEP